jgi:HPt (histidine-containing phosphotransfer) domain-containing protein
MTASALEEDRRACLDAGMDDYIAKPFDHRRLAELLNAVPSAPSPSRSVQTETARGIDAAALEDLSVRVGTEALVAIIDLFTRDANELLGALRKDFAREDAARVLRTAHTLKSTAATLGAASLASAAEELEILMRHGDVTSAGAVIDGVESRLRRVLDELAPERERRVRRRD